MSGRELRRQSAQYVLARGVPGLVNLLALGLFTRLLDADEYGRYTLVIAGVGLLNLVLFNWLKLGLLRFLPAHREDPTRLLSTVAAGFLGVVALTGLAGVTSAAVWSEPTLRDFLAVGLGVLWSQAWLNNSLEMARARLDPIRYGRVSLMKAVLGLAFGGGLAWAGLGAHGILLGLVLGSFLPSAWLMRRDWRGVRPHRPDRPLMSEILRYGLPLSVTASLSFILASSDRFMIKIMLSDGEVGLYAAGYDLAHHILTVIGITIGLAATPLAINALERGGWDEARAQYLENGKLFMAVVVPAGVGLFILTRGVVDLVIGPEFRDAAYGIFPWVVVGSFMSGTKFYYLDSAFFLHKHTSRLLLTIAPAAILNIVLNLLWLPEHGYIAAAWSTFASYALALLLTLIYVGAVLRMPLPWMVMVRVVIAAGLMGAVIVWTQRAWSPHLVVQIGIGVLVYGGLGWLVGVPLVRDLFATGAARWRRS